MNAIPLLMPSLLLPTYSWIPCLSPQDRMIQVNEWIFLQEDKIAILGKAGSLAPPPFLYAFPSYGVEISRPRKVLFAWVKPIHVFSTSYLLPSGKYK